MKLAIMQPYFMPYVGYFQLMTAVDVFVLYDNIKYTKKGWINRNRMLLNGKDETFSLPLKKDSDLLDVVERELAADFNPDKLLKKFKGAYRRAPFYEQTCPLLERIVRYEEPNLFRYLHYAIASTAEHLGIETEIRFSSGILIDHDIKGQDKVLALCEATGATTYINAIGGMELYATDAFHGKGIELKFIKSKQLEYTQFGDPFVPCLSIIDVMMFNSIDSIRTIITTNYELI
jgi:hypothetical protein